MTKIPNRDYKKLENHVHHQLAYYDNKEDMKIHLNYLKRMHSRKVTVEELKELVEFRNKVDDNQLEEKFWASSGTLLVGN